MRLPAPALLALLPTLAACSGGASTGTGAPTTTSVVLQSADAAPPVTRLAIRLSGPGPVSSDPTEEAVHFHATVTVPGGFESGGDALVLSGVFGTATVSFDGATVAVVTGGPGPNEVDLADKVPAGRHDVDISLTRAGTPPPMILGGDRHTTPMLVDPPVLLLRPKAHVERFAVPLADGKVTPTAMVSNAPDGATVRFVAALDGELAADLGTAPVVNGVADAPAVPWTLPQWKLSAPALYEMFAILQNADGRVLDAYGARMAPRADVLTDTGFNIGGEDTRLVGWRSGPRPFTPPDFGALIRTGANAFEYHGSPASEHQLGVFDETGIAVVLTPRCEGTFSVVPVDQRAGIVDANIATINDQSMRSAWDMARHPSVVLWISESIGLTALADAIASTDPEHRPVVNKDLRMENVTLGKVTQPANYSGAFVGETAWEGPMGSVDVSVKAFGEALRGGVRGGMLEHWEDADREAAWAPLLKEQKIPPVTIAGRRGESRVMVSGAGPGLAVWVDAPWLPAEAVVATGQSAGLNVWYKGKATIVAAGERKPVDLTPRVWSELGLTGEVAKVSL